MRQSWLAITECWTFSENVLSSVYDRILAALIADSPCFFEEMIMAHKKIERKKELDRRRHRRQERLRQRAREAKIGRA
jgi:hypothetical protein